MTAPTTPRWLHAHAARTGDDPTLVGGRARTRWCRTCGLVVIAGYDAPLIATLAICDPYALDWKTEAAAVILARPTWRLWGTPNTWLLTDRHIPGVHPIAHHPPADPHHDVIVLARHICGTPPLSRTPIPEPPTRAPFDTDSPPPF